jgi:hypothetical protein
MQLSTLCAYLSRRGRSFAWLLRRGALALAVLVLLWLLLELWPSAAHSTLVFCGRNLFLSWMEVSSPGQAFRVANSTGTRPVFYSIRIRSRRRCASSNSTSFW